MINNPREQRIPAAGTPVVTAVHASLRLKTAVPERSQIIRIDQPVATVEGAPALTGTRRAISPSLMSNRTLLVETEVLNTARIYGPAHFAYRSWCCWIPRSVGTSKTDRDIRHDRALWERRQVSENE
jgi:hypothetical protein